jgi:CPA1 family monovalent cation:H+ antiporter
VVLVTPVLQGMTLRPLMAWLDVHDDGTVEREVRLARVEALRAAFDAIAACGGNETAELLRGRYALRLRRAEGTHEDDHDDEEDAEVVRVATTARSATSPFSRSSRSWT